MKSNAKLLSFAILVLALLGFFAPLKKAFAEYQIYSPGSSVTVGDFVYDDSFNPTSSPCSILIADPSGNNVLTATTTGDSTGWHSYSFVPTPVSGPINGVWPATLSCGSNATGDLVREDRSFIVGFTATDTSTLSSTIASSVTTSVWNNATRTLTDYATSSITSSVWGSAVRTLTDYSTSSIATAIWTSPARTLTSFGTLVADITSSVWSNTSRTLTAFGSLAGDVWNNTFAPTRELTDQTLTSGGSLATQTDVNNASSSIVTQVLANHALISSLNNISAADVWAYGARSLTSGGGTVDLTASSTLAIWNIAKSNLVTTGSIGKLIADNLDATISSRSTSTLTAADVWASATRTLSDYSTSTITSAVWNSASRTLTNYGNNITAADVWNTLSSSLTTAGTIGAQVASVSTSTISSAVWNNPTRNLTDYATSSIATAVWTSPTRNLTDFGTLVSDIWGYSGGRTLSSIGSLAADIWNNTFAPTRELTDQTLTSGGKIATQTDVTNASSSVITAVLNNNTLINNLHNIQASDVWAYGTRSLTTSSGGAVDLTASSTQAIWDVAKSNLVTTGSIGKLIADNLDATISSRGTSTSTLTAADVWAAATRTLTDYSTSSVATAVWSNAARTLTNYGNNITAADVWNVLSSSLTTTGTIGAQVAGVSTSTIASAVWNNPTRNLTDYATSSIATAVWTSPTRNLTDFGTLVSDIWGYSGGRTLSSIGSLAADIWNNSFAPTRELTDQTLTSGGKIATQADVNNATSSIITQVLANRALISSLNNISAADVWAYGARSLTSGGGTVDLTASSTLAIWNVAKASLSTSGSIGKLIADNLDATISSRGTSTSTLTAADVWAAATRTLTDYATSSVASGVWSNASRTLTNYGNNITAADVWNVLSSSLSTPGTIGQQVAGLSTSGSSTIVSTGWSTHLTDTSDILEGSTYRATVYVSNGVNPSDPFAVPNVTIYDTNRNVVVSNVAMTQIGTGIYNYTYSVPGAAVQGQWETVVQTQVYSGATIQTSDYWQVSGSPAQVIITGMANTTVPTATANVTITNEGTSDYEYAYEWCVVTSSGNPCGGSDDVFYESAAKYILSGQSWNTTLSANVPAAGNYYFKVVVYYGTKSSGSARTFTETVSNNNPPPTGGGGAGGGGFAPTPTPAPTKSICKGADLNLDSKVNSTDFSILLFFWKTRPPFANKCVDMNQDGQVNSVDFSILLYQWGSAGIPIKLP